MGLRGRTVAWAYYRVDGSIEWMSLTHIRKAMPSASPIQRTLCGLEIPFAHPKGTIGRGQCRRCHEIDAQARVI